MGLNKWIAIIFFLSIKFAVAQQGADNPGNELEALIATEDSTQVKALIKASTVYKNKDPHKALKFTAAAIKMAEKIGYQEGLIKAYIESKKCYFWANEYQNALKSAEKALEYAKELKNPYWLIEAYFNVGDINFTISDYVNALRNQLEALKIAEPLEVNTRLLDLYNAVGIIYFRQKNYEKAEEYFQKGLKKTMILNDSAYLASVYDNLAILDAMQKKYPEAIEKHKLSLKITENIKDTAGIISGNNNLGLAYKKMGKYNEAISQYKIAYKLLQTFKPVDSLWLSYTALNMGNSYTKINEFKNSETLLFEACKYLEKKHDNSGITEAYYNLFELFQAKGDYKEALLYHIKYVTIKDSTFTIEKAKQVTEMQEKYNVEKKDFEIASLNQQNEIKASKLKKQRIIQNSFIGGFVLMLLLILLIYNRYKIKVKSAEELNKANDHLKSTQHQLIQQEKLASLGSLTAGIAHEIKNPLNFVTNFSQLSQELIDELNESDDEEDRKDLLEHLKGNLEKINHHGKRANSIVMSMLQHARGGEGEKQMTDINQICNEFTDLSYQGMRAKIQDFNCEIEKQLDAKLPLVNVIPQDISRVILNLLNNAFYASNEKSEKLKLVSNSEPYRPKITVMTLMKDQTVLIQIKDNGSGISDAVMQKIFEPFFTTKPSGEGTGLGLSICNDIVKAHGGSMKVESKIDSYTEFTITLPI